MTTTERTLDLAADDPREPADRLFRDLRTTPNGLTSREAQRRLEAYGPNELTRRRGTSWVGELLRQLTHPLALLLWLAAALAAVGGTNVLAGAIVAVILLNAALAFVQERQAERAVEALAAYLPVLASIRLMSTVDRADCGMIVLLFELVFAALVVTVPPLAHVFGMAVPPLPNLLVLLAFPVIVWGADELWRLLRRRRRGGDDVR